MNKVKSLIKNKKGNVMILILAVMMCVLMPVIAVIYDLGQIRMYQQDIKNAQEIAGLGCVGVSAGSIGGNNVYGGFSGRCANIAASSAWANLGVQGGKGGQGADRHWYDRVKSVRGKNTRLYACKGEQPWVDVKQTPDKNHFSVQIRGLCYRPLFIKADLLNFQVLKNNPYHVNAQFKDEYPVQVMPSWFSAVYDIKNGQ